MFPSRKWEAEKDPKAFQEMLAPFLHYLRNAASSSFALVLSSRNLTTATRISLESVSVYAFIVTRRPSLPLSVSRLTTFQILLSRSLTIVFPSMPTRPERWMVFLADFAWSGLA